MRRSSRAHRASSGRFFLTTFHPRKDNLLVVSLLLSLVLMMSPLIGMQAEASPAATDSFAIRSVVVSVADANGTPVAGLNEDDFEVTESGVGRDVVEVQGDVWQEVVLLVDTSADFRDAIPSLRKGIETFAAPLREPQRVLLAAFGGSVYHLAGPTADPDVLVRAAGRINARLEKAFLMDAMAEVCSGVTATRTVDSDPPALVIVTGLTADDSSTPLEEVYRLVRESGVLINVILYDPPEQTSRFERRGQLENFLATLAQSSGGHFARALAAGALPDTLGEWGAELMQPLYRVSFLTELEPPAALEGLTVGVTRQEAHVVPIRLMPYQRVVSASATEESNP